MREEFAGDGKIQLTKNAWDTEIVPISWRRHDAIALFPLGTIYRDTSGISIESDNHMKPVMYQWNTMHNTAAQRPIAHIVDFIMLYKHIH